MQEDNSMFTGDNVLGAGSTVFYDLSAYLASLRRMLAVAPTHLYPGHGPAVLDTGGGEGCALIRLYIQHRQQRVDAVARVLREAVAAVAPPAQCEGGGGPAPAPGATATAPPPALAHAAAAATASLDSGSSRCDDGVLTTADVVSAVYAGQHLSANLVPAATRNTLLVLEALVVADDSQVELLSARPDYLDATYEDVARLRWRWRGKAAATTAAAAAAVAEAAAVAAPAPATAAAPAGAGGNEAAVSNEVHDGERRQRQHQQRSEATQQLQGGEGRL
jgi:hypothetical protein